MGLHLHRKLTAILIALMMLMSFQAPAVLGADEIDKAVQETEAEKATQQEVEKESEAKEQKQEAETETEPEEETKAEPEPEPEKETEPKKEETKDNCADMQEQGESKKPSGDTSSEETQADIEITFSLSGDVKHESDQIHLMKRHDLTEWVRQTSISAFR